jgi:hypothetical protein
MQTRGYSRTIVGGNGAVYKLPTGTYVARNTSVAIDVALNAAVAAAQETGKSSAVIVADWTQASWQGLSS